MTIISTIILSYVSCIGNVSFTTQEMRFARPFGEASRIVYKSADGGLTDTILFSKTVTDNHKIRSFERGFYNEKALYVRYEITKGSFHKITVQSVIKEPEYLLHITKNSDSNSSKEISFLGLIFDEDYVNTLLNTEDSVIVFRQENARYKDVNINEGIRSFTLNFNMGIVSFIDDNGVEWIRIN